MGILNVDNLRGVGSGTSVTCLSNRLETTNINASGIITATGGFTGNINTASQGNITSLGTLTGLTIDNNADTSMSSSSAGQLQVGGNGYTGAIALDADAMHIYHNSSIRDMVFGINESEKVRITSDGKVGIGSASPTLGLDINKGANSGVFLGNPTHGYKIRANVSSSNDYGLMIEDEDGVDLYRATSSTGTTNANTHTWWIGGSESLQLTSTKNLSIIDGNLVVAHGHGIDFSANTNDETGAGSISANGEIFDDYEEGSWTPVADGSGTISGTSINYSGWYTKVGRVVHLEFYANNSAGDIEISNYKIFTGLPFATGSGNYGTGRIMTEDGEQLARQGDIIVGGSSFLINKCGSSSGTVRIGGTVTYIAT